MTSTITIQPADAVEIDLTVDGDRIEVTTRQVGEYGVVVTLPLPVLRATVDALADAEDQENPGFPDLMDGGVTCAAIEKEAEESRPGTKPYLSVSFSGLDVDLRVAQRNGPELPSASVDRTGVLQALVTMTDVVREEMVEDGRAVPSWAARPFTPDDISDEMIERAARQYVEEEYTSWERSPAIAKNNARESVLGILEAALAPPPARPEGAEELQRALADLDMDDPAGFADLLAERGVRVTGADR